MRKIFSIAVLALLFVSFAGIFSGCADADEERIALDVQVNGSNIKYDETADESSVSMTIIAKNNMWEHRVSSFRYKVVVLNKDKGVMAPIVKTHTYSEVINGGSQAVISLNEKVNGEVISADVVPLDMTVKNGATAPGWWWFVLVIIGLIVGIILCVYGASEYEDGCVTWGVLLIIAFAIWLLNLLVRV